jgi:hypothetical protein
LQVLPWTRDTFKPQPVNNFSSEKTWSARRGKTFTSKTDAS